MRLIDVDRAMINFGFEWDDITPTADEFFDFLRRQPSVDAVPVIRCKDCKFRYWDDWLEEYFCQCYAEHMQVLPDDFCSNAERKEPNDEQMD